MTLLPPCLVLKEPRPERAAGPDQSVILEGPLTRTINDDQTKSTQQFVLHGFYLTRPKQPTNIIHYSYFFLVYLNVFYDLALIFSYIFCNSYFTVMQLINTPFTVYMAKNLESLKYHSLCQ